MTDMGPIDYLIVEFPDDLPIGEGLPLLVDLVERGIIRLLDLVFIRRNHDDSIVGFALTDFDGDRQVDLTVFQGASSGLVDDDDIGRAGAVLEPGSSAAILVYENLRAAPRRPWPIGCRTRQAGRWARQEAPVDNGDAMLAQLRELAELRSQGALTEAEFEAQKSRILNG